MQKKTLISLGLATIAVLQSQAALAETALMTTKPKPLSANLSYLSSDFPTLQMGKKIHSRPKNAVSIYQWDSKPLGDRAPFLFVHGLRGEYGRELRWTKVINKFNSDPTFAKRYKVYLARFDTLADIPETVPKFREAVLHLYGACGNKPMGVIALSIGGNLVYESMQDKATDNAIKYLLTLGTPFHGSPLFCQDWLQYSVYKRMTFPWTRIDHSVAYKIYFNNNPALKNNLRWDNMDDAIPDIGHFHSHLPFGPKGDLTVANTMNTRLIDIEKQPFDKKKLITYSGYMINPYMIEGNKRLLDTTLTAPYTFFTIKAPAHLAREHAVLRMLNREIGSMVPSETAEAKAGTSFIYQLNDGITPINSALFLPDSAAMSAVKEADVPKLRNLTDVRTARVFRGIDHITFIDGTRPMRRPASHLRDELAPEAGTRNIFSWMLGDVLQYDKDTTQLADKTETGK